MQVLYYTAGIVLYCMYSGIGQHSTIGTMLCSAGIMQVPLKKQRSKHTEHGSGSTRYLTG
jgi:hypothetical protein